MALLMSCRQNPAPAEPSSGAGFTESLNAGKTYIVILYFNKGGFVIWKVCQAQLFCQVSELPFILPGMPLLRIMAHTNHKHQIYLKGYCFSTSTVDSHLNIFCSNKKNISLTVPRRG